MPRAAPEADEDDSANGVAVLLVVDEQPVVDALVAYARRHTDLRISTAASGAAARDRVAAEPIDCVVADPDRLRQVFENLFRNAAEHAGPDATVRVGLLADGRGFYVADDGPGIPEAKRDAVFEHGYTTSDDGTGFGLSIVRSIVEAHGWDIEVAESAAGGARFDVTGVELPNHPDRRPR